MKKILFIYFLFFSFNSWATCKSDPGFQDFVVSNNLFESTQPKTKLSEYGKTKNLSEDCLTEKMQDLIPQLAVQWKKVAEGNNCLDVPPGKSCPKEMRDEIFGNITQVESWGLYLKKSSQLPDHVICKDNEKAPETEVLMGDISDILTIAYKMDRLNSAYNIDDKVCIEKKNIDIKNHPRYNKFKKLYDKGEQAKLDDFLILWDQGLKSKKNIDAYFFDCQSEPWGNIDTFEMVNELRYVSQACKPDTLYSWGPIEKLKNIKNNLPQNEEWRGDPNKREEVEVGTFTALTPVQTFGYGEIVIRFKIKDQTPVAIGRGYVTNSSNTREERVGVRARSDGFQDYTIETASFVESFSYGTPQIYDELVLDIKRYESKKRAQLYKTKASLVLNYSEEPAGGEEDLERPLEDYGLDLLRHLPNIDRHDFSEGVLISRLRGLLKMILNEEGGVYYQKGVCANIDEHYQSKKPTYFNPE